MAKSSPVPEIVLSGTIALIIWKMASDRGMSVSEFVKHMLSSEAERSAADTAAAPNSTAAAAAG
jgi:hypothetical protein